MEYRFVIYSLFASAIAVHGGLVAALIKEWKPLDTDWQNPFNWEGGQLPCAKSEVILPEEVVVSIYMNGTVAWSTLIMPQTGELVLDDNLVLNDDRAQAPVGCRAEQVRFKNWRPSSWFDPEFWQLADQDGSVIEQPLAVPHSERVPCAHDSVHLSNLRSLSVDFSRIESISVGQVRYGDELLTAEELRRNLNSFGWSYQVHHPPLSVVYNGVECYDRLGCRCGNANVTVMQMVCSNAGSLCANQLECSDGFRPPGHCCDMCGAMMKMTVDERVFSKDSLDQLVKSTLQAEVGHSHRGYYLFRSGVNVLHLTIVDNATNEGTFRLADKLRDYLIKDRANENLYGVLTLDLVKSGPSRPPTHHLTPEELQLITSNVMAVFATFVIVGLLATTFYFYRKTRWSSRREDLNSVSFARFQNDSSGNVELAIDAGFSEAMARSPFDMPATSLPEEPQQQPADSPYADEPVVPDASDRVSLDGPPLSKPTAWKKLTRAFANPLFGDPSIGRLSGRWTMSSLMKTSATQENPIFDIRIPPTSASATTTSPTDERPAGDVEPVRHLHAMDENYTAAIAPPALSSSTLIEEDKTALEKGDEEEAAGMGPTAGGNVASEAALGDSVTGDDDGSSEEDKEEEGAVRPDDTTLIVGNQGSAVGSSVVKKLWQKATRKFIPTSSSSDPPPPSAIVSPVDTLAADEPLGHPEPAVDVESGSAVASSHPAVLVRRSEDKMQLTLAEETLDD